MHTFTVCALFGPRCAGSGWWGEDPTDMVRDLLELSGSDDNRTYIPRQCGWWSAPAWHGVKAVMVLAAVIILTVMPSLTPRCLPSRSQPALSQCSARRVPSF